MVAVFQEVRRVLRDDGTAWVNMGDSYAGGGNYRGVHSEDTLTSKQSSNRGARGLSQALGAAGKDFGLAGKQLCGIPWRLAFALQADGWWLRQDIIWAKPNPMPESVTDRCTKAHEYLFLLTKSARYFFDAEAIKEESARPGDFQVTTKTDGLGDGYDGHRTRKGLLRGIEVGPTRNRRSVWTINSEPYPESHFATFPTALVKPCILAGTSAKGCCPKCGAPWERVVEREAPPDSVFTGTSNPDDGLVYANVRNGKRIGSGQKLQNWLNEHPITTTGWRPTCECGDTDTVPCTVLDPFGGSFTTCAVALEFARSAIGIELNPKYIELGEKRCNITPGLCLA